MKKFEFRLGAALRWRNAQLQLERAKLQKLLSEEQRTKRDLQSVFDERASVVSTLTALECLQPSDLRATSAYLMGADMRAHALREEITKLADSIQQQRELLIKTERNVRLLERLRDGRYAEWKREFDKEIELTTEESWLAANFRTSRSEI
ncbi:MAG: hypothetical protein JO182_07590 [Acidobacteriaceae bacterium]|nr:hypothetical protein [Acidobacteriaceae bacterium]